MWREVSQDMDIAWKKPGQENNLRENNYHIETINMDVIATDVLPRLYSVCLDVVGRL